MSKLNSAFVVIHIHTELITHIKITLMSGILEPEVLFIGKVIVTTWSGLEMSISKFGFIGSCRFLLEQVWVYKKVQEFNKSGRQKALANKPPAGHRTMSDTDDVQTVEQRSGIHCECVRHSENAASETLMIATPPEQQDP